MNTMKRFFERVVLLGMGLWAWGLVQLFLWSLVVLVMDYKGVWVPQWLIGG